MSPNGFPVHFVRPKLLSRAVGLRFIVTVSRKTGFLCAVAISLATVTSSCSRDSFSEAQNGDLTNAEARAALDANETALAVIRDTLETLPPGGRMDAQARQVTQTTLTEAGIIQAESSCSDQPATITGFTILPYPETLRAVHTVYRGSAEVDGIGVRRVELHTPEAVAKSYMFIVRSKRCMLSAILMPQGLDIPAELPLIDILTAHLRAGRIAEAEAQIESFSDWDEQDKFGDTLLTAAASANASELVATILDRGINIEQKDRTGATALMVAANRGHTSTLKLLLQRGAAPDTRDNIGYTPMIWAASHGHVEVMELLKEYGAILRSRTAEQYFGGGSTALHRAAALCQQSAALWLLENGADANARDGYGTTPLIEVAPRHCIEIARFLIEHGADINAKTNGGQTALTWAAGFGSLEMIGLLLDSGAEVRRSDIQAAREKGRTEVVSLLTKRRAEK